VAAWLARGTLVALVVAAVVGGVMLVSGVLQVRSSLQDAHADMRALRSALADVDSEAASQALADAEANLEEARATTGSIVWSTASHLPFVRHSTRTIREVVEVAGAAVDIGRVAVDDEAGVLRRGLDLEVIDGEVDLAPLIEARDLVAVMPIADLEVAREGLARPREGWMPQQVLDGRAETLALADEVLTTARLAEDLTTALPGFLGADGPRYYFVGMQTSAHLRGTGGMIGFWGILRVEEGRFSFGQTEVYDVAEDEAERRGVRRGTDRFARRAAGPGGREQPGLRRPLPAASGSQLLRAGQPRSGPADRRSDRPGAVRDADRAAARRGHPARPGRRAEASGSDGLVGSVGGGSRGRARAG
jgi:hypothetical protein